MSQQQAGGVDDIPMTLPYFLHPSTRFMVWKASKACTQTYHTFLFATGPVICLAGHQMDTGKETRFCKISPFLCYWLAHPTFILTFQ